MGYRYPGIIPFQDNELDRKLFKGRETEKEHLFNRITANRLVVLFAKSGIGKSSLLNAGLMQTLRENKYFPLMISFVETHHSPLEWIYLKIEDACKRFNVDMIPGEKNSLWEFFRTAEFWSNEHKLFTPVLILDQFESLFTFYSIEDPIKQNEKRNLFLQLADLVRGRVPQSVLKAQQGIEEHHDWETPPDIRVVISIREDYLAQLEELATELPGIFQNRMRLKPLNYEQARQAIIEPALLEDERLTTKPFKYAPDAIEDIIEFLGRKKNRTSLIKTNEIEAFQLQLICSHIETEIKRQQPQNDSIITVSKKDLSDYEMNRIMQNYYDNQIQKIASESDQKAVRQLCEEGLIKPNGLRRSLDFEDIKDAFGIRKEILDLLVSSRLLRVEPRLESYYYELSHDTLLKPILESRGQKGMIHWQKTEEQYIIASLKKKFEHLITSHTGAIQVRAKLMIDQIRQFDKNTESSQKSKRDFILSQLTAIVVDAQQLSASIRNWNIVEEYQETKNIEINQYLQMVIRKIVVPENIEISFTQSSYLEVKCNPIKLFESLQSILELRIESITNAIGKIHIHTESNRIEGEKSQIVITIRDSGRKIPLREKNLADHPYLITNPNEKINKLAYTINTIRADLSGDITIESQQGDGSIIRIYLPSGNGIQ